MVKKYGILSQNVATAASEVNTAKVQTGKVMTQLTTELQALSSNVAHYDRIVREKQPELLRNQERIDVAAKDLRDVVSSIAIRNTNFGIAASIIPFIGPLIDAAQKAINSKDDSDRLELARDKLNDLRMKRSDLSRDLGQAETNRMHWQFQLTKGEFEVGVVPDPVHLPEVQQNLTRIQKILIELRSFWEKIEMLVKHLEQKTFADETLVEYLEVFKEDFLKSIECAAQAWVIFRDGCTNVRAIFALKTKDAYKFLERSPPSLKDRQWKPQYDTLKERLEKFYPPPNAPAIGE